MVGGNIANPYAGVDCMSLPGEEATACIQANMRAGGNVSAGGAPPGAGGGGETFDSPFVEVDLAPGARALREESLEGTRALGEDLQGDINALRARIEEVRRLDPMSEELARMESLLGELESNQNPFIQARTAPFRRALERDLAGARRGFQRRGVSGGLVANTLATARAQGEAGISEQAALATQESIQARRGLIQDLAQGRMTTEQFRQGLVTNTFDQILARQGALDQVNARVQSLSAQELQEELAALGLGQQTIQQILASQFPETTRTQAPTSPAGIGQILGGIGQIARGFGGSRQAGAV